jgi:hypothetical protein
VGGSDAREREKLGYPINGRCGDPRRWGREARSRISCRYCSGPLCAGCSQASAPNSTAGAALEGPWFIDGVGYENGEYQEREVRFVMEESTGATFAREKSWREIVEEWSAPETISGTVLDRVEFRAVDPTGTSSARSCVRRQSKPAILKRA